MFFGSNCCFQDNSFGAATAVQFSSAEFLSQNFRDAKERLAGWFGGGDVKLLTVVSLWAGPAHITQLLLIMSVSGMLLGLGIIATRRWIALTPARERAWLGPLPGWAVRGKCPYGIAIGVGALAVLLVPAT